MSKRIPKTLLSSLCEVYDLYDGRAAVSIKIERGASTISIVPFEATKESEDNITHQIPISQMKGTF